MIDTNEIPMYAETDPNGPTCGTGQTARDEAAAWVAVNQYTALSPSSVTV